MTGVAKQRRLDTVEMARGLAALAVVLFHSNVSADEFRGPQPSWPSFGEHGVDFFFVLSGFIIFVAHHSDIGRPGQGGTYLLKRAIRLLPLLWVVVLGWAGLRLAMGAPVAVPTILRSLLLWPSLEATLPSAVWTLRHEVLFYLAFLVLIVRPFIGCAIFVLWATTAFYQLLAVALGQPVRGVPSMLVSSFTLDFLLGAGVAMLFLRGKIVGGWVPLVVAVTAMAAALWFEDRMGWGRTGLADYVSTIAEWWTLVLGILCAALLYGLLAIENRVVVPRWGLTLGSASYAIYLVHVPVNSFVQRIAIHLPARCIAWGVGHLLLILAGTAAGLVIHFAFEAPVGRALRSRLQSNRALPERPIAT